MPYSNFKYIYDRFKAVSTMGITPEEFDPSIAWADANIDAYAASRYVVPFASTPESTPPLVRELSCVLALIHLGNRHPGVLQWIQNMIEWANNMLAAIRDGDVTITDADGNAVTQSEASTGIIRPSTADYIPIFGVQRTLYEQVDYDRQQDEADERDTEY